MIGDTYAPALGQPSLTASEITALYQQYLGRAPYPSELSSELENANKYSAAAIERQISLRAGNAPGSGVRGDEGAPSLTIARPNAPAMVVTPAGAPVGSLATMGAAGTLDTAPTVGPTGLSQPNTVPGRTFYYGEDAPMSVSSSSAGGGGLFGMDAMTMVVVAGVAAAAYFLLKG